MTEKKEEITTEILLSNIIEGVKNLKAKDIVSIDLTSLEHRICKYFVICHGDSNTHVNAIAESVTGEVKEKLDIPAVHKEGQDNACWILLDYGAVVVHVFQKECRDFYLLEELWADGKIERID